MKNNTSLSELPGIISSIWCRLFRCSPWATLAPRQVHLTGTQKSLFSWNLNHSWILQKHLFLHDTFSSRFSFPWQRKRVNVIPFLMGEQANLLSLSIVDWLGDGGEAGDKRKSTEKIGLFDFFSTSLSPALLLWGGWLSLLLDYPDVSYSPSPRMQSPFSPSLCLLVPGRHWSPCCGKFLCLLRCSPCCFDALSFTGVQWRGTQPCRYDAGLPGCGW